MTPLVRQLGDFAAAVDYADLPDEVRSSLRERVLDVVGLGLASRPLETSRMAYTVAVQWGGPAEARLIGSNEQLPAAAAAFFNATLAHSLDFDDTHLPSVLHPSASIVPTVAGGGRGGRSQLPARFWPAAAGAYEICVRTGMAAYDRELGNSVFFERGWHGRPRSAAPLASSAVAATRLYGLGAEADGATPWGSPCSMGSGIIEAQPGRRLRQAAPLWLGGPRRRWSRRSARGPKASPARRRPSRALRLLPGLLRRHHVPSRRSPGGLGSRVVHSRASSTNPTPPTTSPTRGSMPPYGAWRECGRSEEIARASSCGWRLEPDACARSLEPREEKIRPQSGYHGPVQSGPFTVAAALLGGGRPGALAGRLQRRQRARDPRVPGAGGQGAPASPMPECDAIFPNQFPAILDGDARRTAASSTEREGARQSRRARESPERRRDLKVKF